MSLQVVNLAHLAYLIRSSTERFIKLELEWNKVGQKWHQRVGTVLGLQLI